MPGELITFVGDPAEAGSITLVVTAVRFEPCARAFDRAEPGHTYALVDVVLVNSPSAPFAARTDAVVVDDAGERYGSVDACGGEMATGTLNPGDRRELTLAFEIPGAASGLWLVYGPLPATDETTIFVKLE